MNEPSRSKVRASRHAARFSVGVMTADRLMAGRLGERLAARHLERNGYRIVDRNYRAREGEIDLVATRGATLVFCEVKTLVARESYAAGPAHPLEAVGPAKRRQVRRIARLWIAERRRRGFSIDIRFDAIGVSLSRRGELIDLEHVENAF
jgi:putative endonuclease